MVLYFCKNSNNNYKMELNLIIILLLNILLVLQMENICLNGEFFLLLEKIIV